MEKDMQNEMEIGLIQGPTRILPLVLIGCWYVTINPTPKINTAVQTTSVL